MNAKKVETPNTESTQKRAAIVQLTRIGDLIQTYQACISIKESHPDLKITLFAREQFASPLNFILKTLFDEIVFLDQETQNNPNSFVSLINHGTSYEQYYDIVVNLSYCKLSTKLCGALQARFKVGPYNNEDLIRMDDRWSQYIYSNVLGGTLSPFNLVDLFKLVLGVNLKTQVTWPTPAKRKHLGKRILFHPFSSGSKKTWSTNKWLEVIYATLKDCPNSIVYVTGAIEDQESSDKIIESNLLSSFSNRIVNITAKYNIEELYQFLAEIDLFIGHDSMVSHLAALHHLPSIVVALGTVKQHESFPYNENAFVVSPRTPCFPCTPQTNCDHLKCHLDVSHMALGEIIKCLTRNESALVEKKFNELPPFRRDKMNLYSVKKSAQSNLFHLQKIDNGYLDSQDLFRQFYRISWQFFLEEIEETHSLPAISKEGLEEIFKYSQGLEYLYELCDFGKKYSHFIIDELAQETPSLVKIKSYSLKIDEIDQLQVLIKKTYPNLSPIVNFFSIQKANLIGNTVSEIAQSSYLTFEDFSLMIKLNFDLFQKVLNKNNYRPSKDVQKGPQAETE
jgi:ADP-heptose:LPS heptosyltransferase